MDSAKAYSMKALLAQSPEKIKNWFLAVGAAGVIVFAARGYTITGEMVAAVGLAVERTLDLLYVAPVRQAQSEAAALVAFEAVKARASDPTKPEPGSLLAQPPSAPPVPVAPTPEPPGPGFPVQPPPV